MTLSILIALAAAQAPDEQAAHFPRAAEFLERDWALSHWAVKTFDADGDGRVSIDEAQPALRLFREIADGNRDGRITPYEYDRAREYIIARY